MTNYPYELLRTGQWFCAYPECSKIYICIPYVIQQRQVSLVFLTLMLTFFIIHILCGTDAIEKKNKANELIQLIHTYNWYIHRYVWKKLSTKSGYMFSNIRPTSYTVSKLDPFMGLDQLLVSFNILPTLSKWRNNSELKAFSDLEIWFT